MSRGMQAARGQHYLERAIAPVLRAGTAPVLLASGAAIAVIAVADWYVGPTVSRGVRYPQFPPGSRAAIRICAGGLYGRGMDRHGPDTFATRAGSASARRRA